MVTRILIGSLTLSLVLSGNLAAEERSRDRQRDAILGMADKAEGIVEKIRGLEFQRDVKINVMGRSEFRRYLEERMIADLPEGYLETYQKAYAALGLIPRDYDLEEGLLSLLEQGVAGLYDDKEEALYVFEDVPLDGNTEMTLAHELCHALEDQHFDLTKHLEAVQELDNEDREFAIRGLVEGSATALMYRYLTEAGINPMQLLSGQLELAGSAMSGMPDDVPLVILRDLSLAYTTGMTWANAQLRKRGRWKNIDRAFDDPPISSEQILHPAKYGKDLPVVIEVPDLGELAGEGWNQIWENTLGEMRFAAWTDVLRGKKESFLSSQMSSGTNRVATGWDGDRYAVLEQEGTGDLAVALVSEWDSERDAIEAFEHLVEHALRKPEREGQRARTRDGDRVTHVERMGSRVVFVRGFPGFVTEDVVTLLSQLPAPEFGEGR